MIIPLYETEHFVQNTSFHYEHPGNTKDTTSICQHNEENYSIHHSKWREHQSISTKISNGMRKYMLSVCESVSIRLSL